MPVHLKERHFLNCSSKSEFVIAPFILFSSLFERGANPGLFLIVFFFLRTDNLSSKQESNSGCQSKRQRRWPLDHHYGFPYSLSRLNSFWFCFVLFPGRKLVVHLGVVDAGDAQHGLQPTPPGPGHHRLPLPLPRDPHLHLEGLRLEGRLVQQDVPRLPLPVRGNGALQQHLHDRGHRGGAVHRPLPAPAAAVLAAVLGQGLHLSGHSSGNSPQHSQVLRSRDGVQRQPHHQHHLVRIFSSSVIII